MVAVVIAISTFVVVPRLFLRSEFESIGPTDKLRFLRAMARSDYRRGQREAHLEGQTRGDMGFDGMYCSRQNKKKLSGSLAGHGRWLEEKTHSFESKATIRLSHLFRVLPNRSDADKDPHRAQERTAASPASNNIRLRKRLPKRWMESRIRSFWTTSIPMPVIIGLCYR
jgi:hypothetical protein